ncbi:AcaB family transcriptional regulator [Pseudomonas sp.]|uniref:AcaB family transcriptional regulator n=1 Tax=Pseudomonas sp. TaxID=306 RepID=UPI00261E7080|nr:AcaB family transcriptional regulator [Pseudomonas sp.]
MAEPIQLNLGALPSTMDLTLHTHHAARIWYGRTASDEKNGIIGLSGFVGIMNKMKRGAELDDPYSDRWIIQVVVVKIPMVEDSIDQQLWGLLEGRRALARDLVEEGFDEGKARALVASALSVKVLV